MAESQCKAVENNQRSFCIGSQPFLPTRIPYFFNCFRYAYCHALCTSDASFLRASVITLTSQLVLARHQASRKYFAGGKWWLACAYCSCSPCASPAPPATPVRWLGLA
jgi:hypothetical protein